MLSVIKQIFFGGDGIHDKFCDSARYRKITKEYDVAHNKLEATLNDEQKQMLDDLWMLSAGLESETAYLRFADGLKFGLQLAVEAFGHDFSDLPRFEEASD